MRVLVACEYSGRVREAFRKLGHDAWSCDLLPADDNSPYHYQCDVFEVIDKGWDLMIAHPPCTYLTNAGVRWLYRQEGRWDKMREGAKFFKKLLDAPIPKIAVENPIMHKYAVEIIGRRQNQVIQPWMFGHMERKGTCLWLKGLPKLTPTDDVKAEMLKLPKNVQQRMLYLPPSPDRWKLRSTTYQGIADAMAEQWGVLSDRKDGFVFTTDWDVVRSSFEPKEVQEYIDDLGTIGMVKRINDYFKGRGIGPVLRLDNKGGVKSVVNYEQVIDIA